jgi:hypothetical protein
MVLKRDAHVLSIKSKGESADIHVQTHTQNTFLFELLTIWNTKGVRIVAQLAQPVVGKAKFIV